MTDVLAWVAATRLLMAMIAPRLSEAFDNPAVAAVAFAKA